MTRSISQFEALLLDLPHISDEVKEGIRQLANDAKRYQWLVQEFGETKLPCFLERNTAICGYVADGKKGIDAAIDAVREGEKV